MLQSGRLGSTAKTSDFCWAFQPEHATAFEAAPYAEENGADAPLDSLVEQLSRNLDGESLMTSHAIAHHLSWDRPSAGTAVGPLVMVTPPPQAPADEASTTDAPAASAIVHCVLEDVAKGPPRWHWCARHSQTPADARVPSGSGRSMALSLGSWHSRWADC